MINARKETYAMLLSPRLARFFVIILSITFVASCKPRRDGFSGLAGDGLTEEEAALADDVAAMLLAKVPAYVGSQALLSATRKSSDDPLFAVARRIVERDARFREVENEGLAFLDAYRKFFEQHFGASDRKLLTDPERMVFQDIDRFFDETNQESSAPPPFAQQNLLRQILTRYQLPSNWTEADLRAQHVDAYEDYKDKLLRLPPAERRAPSDSVLARWFAYIDRAILAALSQDATLTMATMLKYSDPEIRVGKDIEAKLGDVYQIASQVTVATSAGFPWYQGSYLDYDEYIAHLPVNSDAELAHLAIRRGESNVVYHDPAKDGAEVARLNVGGLLINRYIPFNPEREETDPAYRVERAYFGQFTARAKILLLYRDKIKAVRDEVSRLGPKDRAAFTPDKLKARLTALLDSKRSGPEKILHDDASSSSPTLELNRSLRQEEPSPGDGLYWFGERQGKGYWKVRDEAARNDGRPIFSMSSKQNRDNRKALSFARAKRRFSVMATYSRNFLIAAVVFTAAFKEVNSRLEYAFGDGDRPPAAASSGGLSSYLPKIKWPFGGWFAGGDAQAMRMFQDQKPENSGTNSDDRPSTPVYQVEGVGRDELMVLDVPTEQQIERWRASPYVHARRGYVEKDATLIGKVPHFPSEKGYLPVPTPFGYEPVDVVVRSFKTHESVDYSVRKVDGLNLYFVAVGPSDVSRFANEGFHLEASFVVDTHSRGVKSDLTVPISRLVRPTEQLADAGFTVLAGNIDKYLKTQQVTTDRVPIKALEEIFQESSYYSHRSERWVFTMFSQNPFAEYMKYVYEGCAFFECDGSNGLFQTYLVAAKTSDLFQVEDVTALVKEPGSDTVFLSPGHAYTRLVLAGDEGLVANFDVTPTTPDPASAPRLPGPTQARADATGGKNQLGEREQQTPPRAPQDSAPEDTTIILVDWALPPERPYRIRFPENVAALVPGPGSEPRPPSPIKPEPRQEPVESTKESDAPAAADEPAIPRELDENARPLVAQLKRLNDRKKTLNQALAASVPRKELTTLPYFQRANQVAAMLQDYAIGSLSEAEFLRAFHQLYPSIEVPADASPAAIKAMLEKAHAGDWTLFTKAKQYAAAHPEIKGKDYLKDGSIEGAWQELWNVMLVEPWAVSSVSACEILFGLKQAVGS